MLHILIESSFTTHYKILILLKGHYTINKKGWSKKCSHRTVGTCVVSRRDHGDLLKLQCLDTTVHVLCSEEIMVHCRNRSAKTSVVFSGHPCALLKPRWHGQCIILLFNLKPQWWHRIRCEKKNLKLQAKSSSFNLIVWAVIKKSELLNLPPNIIHL